MYVSTQKRSKATPFLYPPRGLEIRPPPPLKNSQSPPRSLSDEPSRAVISRVCKTLLRANRTLICPQSLFSPCQGPHSTSLLRSTILAPDNSSGLRAAGSETPTLRLIKSLAFRHTYLNSSPFPEVPPPRFCLGVTLLVVFDEYAILF